MSDITIPKPETDDEKFHNGDPAAGAEGTIVTAEWLNGVIDALTAIKDGKLDASAQIALSDAIDSNSSAIAASSKAVKLAYELANTAQNTATSVKEVALLTHGSVGSNNLDKFKTPGSYSQGSGSPISKYGADKNSPFNKGYTLLVTNWATGTDCIQLATAVDGEQKMRYYNEVQEKWHDWVNTNQDLFDDKLSKTGGVVSGNLIVQGKENGGLSTTMVVDNQGEGKNTSAAIQFRFHSPAVTKGYVGFVDDGQGGAVCRIWATPPGDPSKTRVAHALTVDGHGRIFTPKYGYLDEFFVNSQSNNAFLTPKFGQIAPLGYYPGGVGDNWIIADGTPLTIGTHVSQQTANNYLNSNFVKNWNATCTNVSKFNSSERVKKIVISDNKLYLPDLQTAYFFLRHGSDGWVVTDAIRKITGSFRVSENVQQETQGVFTHSARQQGPGSQYNNINSHKTISFDISKQVPTSFETRPKNLEVTAYIYIGDN